MSSPLSFTLVVAENPLAEEQKKMIQELNAMGFRDLDKILRVVTSYPQLKSTNEVVEELLKEQV